MLKGHFVPCEQGNVFVTQFGEITDNTAVLCLPSITEELNLSRAVVAKQAHVFANAGLASFVIDYYGTGDSEGEFEQATPDMWLANIVTVGQWLLKQGFENIILWGVRFGGLLMLTHQDLLHQKLPITQQLLWKPVLNGKQFFGQFLRIKQAHEMMKRAAGDNKINWRDKVLSGEQVEVSGYLLTKSMLLTAESLVVEQKFQPKTPLVWLELASKTISPAVNKVLAEKLDDNDKCEPFDCPPFWQVPEIFELPELYDFNVSLLIGLDRHA